MFLIYPILFLTLLFIGAEFSKKGQWNDEFLSLKQSKAIQGFCVIGIMLHHMAQKTCASWLDSQFIIHGLDAFLPIGYLLVGFFLFSSGYGLYKSNKLKENYLTGFFGKRIAPILVVYIISILCFYGAGGASNPYTWYVFAIIYLYIVFYLSFRWSKREWVSILLLVLLTILYIITCNWLVIGTWWYNTAFLFPLGVIFARYENKIITICKRFYLALLPLCFIFLAGLFYLAEIMMYSGINRMCMVLIQQLAAIFFVCMLLLMNLKIKFKNKVLDFTGSITLEIYLIHGLFVQLFGFSFVKDDLKSLCYIKNIPLYVIVVLICGILAAWGLYWCRKGFFYLCNKYNKLFRVLKRDFKRICIGLVVVLVVTSVIMIITDHRRTGQRQLAVNQYEEEFITKVDVGSSKMAAYITGEADETIVILRGMHDPCPTITMKELADCLSSNYKVVVIDYFGSGFSDNTDNPRSSVNISKEINETLVTLGINNPVILMPIMESGCHAQTYVNMYPDKVKAVVGIDVHTTEYIKAKMNIQQLSFSDYKRLMKRDSVLNYSIVKFLGFTGYKEFLWPIYEIVFGKSAGQKNMDVAHQLFFDNFYSKNTVQEMRFEYDNLIAVSDFKYPENIKVLDLYSNYQYRNYMNHNIDLDLIHKQICQTEQQHDYELVVDSMYCLCSNPETIREILLRKGF